MRLARAFAVGNLLFRRWTALMLAAAVGILALTSGSAAGVDRLFLDLRDSIRSHPASGEVHIVEIDAASLAAIHTWPWPRSVHAVIVDRLREAGARTIAFDVDFSAPSEPDEDGRLAAALDRAGGRVILPTFRQKESANSAAFIDAVPIPMLRDRSFLAVVNVTPDADGYVRQLPVGLKTAAVPRPSLAALVAESDASINRGFDVDFSIDPASIPRHSVIDLIQGRVPASELSGKRILIGASAVEMGDRYAVPRHGVIPGVVIQALAAETLMAGPVPQRIGAVWALLATLLLIAAASSAKRPAVRTTILVGGLLALVLMPFAAISWFAVTVPIAPALTALAAVGLLGATRSILERVRHRLQTDPDTGLPNLAALQRDAALLSDVRVVVARIDGFPAIASALGPELARTFVQRVADRVRYAAAAGVVYRTRETALAWIEQDQAEDMGDRIEAVVAVMRNPIDCGRMIDASVHLGIAAGKGGEAKQILADATLAAENAAREGIRSAWFSETDSNEADRQLTLLGELDAAMRTGQIWNAYQPKLDVATGQIVGAEALVRWEHPVRGLIRPDLFIPIVEQAGRIRDLTLHVLHQALEDAMHWQQQGHALSVAVNVSAKLLADHEFIELARQSVQGHSLPAAQITIEVTETAAMLEPDRAIAALESWRSLGVRISIDDYGTGQSSLGYLQKLPATELKIDKSFVQSVSHDSRNAAMVRSTINLAHELGMTVVAEGVEDAECLAALAAMGCDKAQGYFIGRPASSAALLSLVAEDFRLVA